MPTAAQLSELARSRHPEYDGELFDLLRATYEGGRALLSPKFIARHHREDPELYHQRVSQASYTNYIAGITATVVDFVFQQPVVRTSPADPFLQNVDRTGTPVGAFMRRVGRELLVMGVTFVAADLPLVDRSAIRSRADELEAGIGAYWSLVRREDLLSFELDERGQPLWVLLREPPAPSGGPFAKPVRGQRFKLWTRQDWTRFETDPQGQRAKIVAAGGNEFGRVPMVAAYAEQTAPWQGRSWHCDTAFLARQMLNLSTLRDQLSRECGLELLAIPGNAEDIEDFVKSPAYVLCFRPQPGVEGPSFVAPSGTGAAILRQHLLDLRDDMFRLTRQRLINLSASADGASGASKAQDFSTTNATLAGLADELERCENALHALTAELNGDPLVQRATYADEFDTGAIDLALERLLKIEQVGDPALASEAREQLARELAPGKRLRLSTPDPESRPDAASPQVTPTPAVSGGTLPAGAGSTEDAHASV